MSRIKLANKSVVQRHTMTNLGLIVLVNSFLKFTYNINALRTMILRLVKIHPKTLLITLYHEEDNTKLEQISENVTSIEK